MSEPSDSISPQRPAPPNQGVDPEALTLRGRPRRVTRFKRRLVIGIVALCCAGIVAATWFGLDVSGLRKPRIGQELSEADHKSTPDGLAALPRSYDQLKPPTAPQLGPPLPGDLGPPMLRQERNAGMPPQPGGADQGLRPNPLDDAARAERLRIAQQARQAREAGVFFQLSRTDHGSDARPETATGQGSATASVTQTTSVTGGRLDLDPERDQNFQQRKLDFLGKPVDQAIYNPHRLQDPVSPYEVLAGSTIAASLITGIDSDLPGLVVAQVIENTYDTVSGRYLLIPQGARLIGSYDSVVAFGQSRALVAWQRIVMPDGTSILIDNLPAADTAGYAGFEDQVDYHTWRLLEGIAMSTLLGVGTQVTFGSQQSDLVQAIRQSTQDSANQAGQRIAEKNLNIQPTITIRPGWPVRVVVHKDLVLKPYAG